MRHITAHTPIYRSFGCRTNRCKARSRLKVHLRMIVILVLAGMLISLSSLPAAAGNVSIEADSHWIKGSAQQAPLGEVLGRLSDATGCEILIDEKLYDTPVTFNMSDPVPSEQAIRRMIHPYSNAMVYEAVPGTDQIRIQQIKVFDQGGPVARYVHAVGRGTQGSSPSYARGAGETRLSTLLSSKGISSGQSAVQKNVRPALTVERDGLGLPRFNYGGKQHGADFRPTAEKMRKAYAQYKKDRQAYAQRSEQARMISGRQQAMQNLARYRYQRNQAIKNRLTSKTNP